MGKNLFNLVSGFHESDFLTRYIPGLFISTP